jgi:hypothetical protein
VAKGKSLYDEAAAWLSSPDGIKAAKIVLSKKKAPIEPRDLCAEAILKVWNFINRHPDKDVEDMKAYCYQVMLNYVRDLLAGTHDLGADDDRLEYLGHDQEDSDDDEGSDVREEHDEVPEIPLVAPSSDDDVDLWGKVRVFLEGQGSSPLKTSAVLSYITMANFPEVDCSELPYPRRGAAKVNQAPWWPCLHLAHQDWSIFPPETAGAPPGLPPELARHRKYRSRKIQDARNLLMTASAAAGVKVVV